MPKYNASRFSNSTLQKYLSKGGNFVEFYRRFQYPELWLADSDSVPPPPLPSPVEGPNSPDPDTKSNVQNQVLVEDPKSRLSGQVISDTNSDQTFSCPPKQFNTPRGCWMFPSGQNLIDRKTVNFNRPYGVKEPTEIYSAAYGDPIWRGSHDQIPLGSKYTEEQYYQPILDSDRKISTGVMMNAYTGKLYETFEDDLPPPDTNKEIPKEQLQQTNPRLIQMFGGLDPNRPLPTKRDVPEYIPGKDAGPNRWGDNLYSDRRRAELQERAQRTVFLNRDGDYPVAPLRDEVPAGYVGFQRAYQPVPYLPATNRNSTAAANWLGPPQSSPAAEQGPLEIQHNQEFCNVVGKPVGWRTPQISDPIDGVGRPIRITPDMPLTERMFNNEITVLGGAEREGSGSNATRLKTATRRSAKIWTMEGPFPVMNAEGTVNAMQLRQLDVKPALRAVVGEHTFPVRAVDGTLAEYLVINRTPPETTSLKAVVAEQPGYLNGASDGSMGALLPFQGPLNSTKRHGYGGVAGERLSNASREDLAPALPLTSKAIPMDLLLPDRGVAAAAPIYGASLTDGGNHSTYGPPESGEYFSRKRNNATHELMSRLPAPQLSHFNQVTFPTSTNYGKKPCAPSVLWTSPPSMDALRAS